MKPRVFSEVWWTLPERTSRRVWQVAFTDSCGCDYTEDFDTHATALRFALHIAGGGSRWEFVR